MNPILRLEDVCRKINNQPILRGVNLAVNPGENLVILGRSGGGKSVLLRHIMGLMRPDSGALWFEGHNLAVMNEESLIPVRRDMGMLFQNGALFDSMTVGENVAFALREEKSHAESEIQALVEKGLKLVGLGKQEHKMPAELSGGMRKRVALARATVRHPKMMLYDEPTAGLDPIVSDSINKLIVRLGEELNMTAIVVTHDMNSAYEIADKIALLHEGRIYCVHTPQEIQESEDPVIYNFVRGISTPTDIEV